MRNLSEAPNELPEGMASVIVLGPENRRGIGGHLPVCVGWCGHRAGVFTGGIRGHAARSLHPKLGV